MNDPEIKVALAELLEKKAKRINDFEQDFITSIQERQFLSEKQREVGQRILSEKSSSTSDRAAAREDQWEEADGCERCTDGVVVMQRTTERHRRFTYDVDPHYEAAFCCVCPKGELRKSWGQYRHNAIEAFDDGWRTKHYLERQEHGEA